jgi:CheY-like chemotaxis protein
VIDDDPAACEVIGRYLAAEGLRVVTAGDGAEGLQRARMIAPQVIILDILLPKMDGWAVLSALKADPALAAIPVIVVTIVDNHELGFALGAAAYLTKPIERAALVEAVNRYRPTAGAAGQVLVVEDDAPTRAMLRRMLEGDGWAVVEAANGRVALEQVATHPPTLMLLDLMMPELDGFGVVAALRHEPAWRSIPVVVLTARDLSRAEQTQLAGSVADVLQKGAYRREDLLREVRDLVRAQVPVS